MLPESCSWSPGLLLHSAIYISGTAAPQSFCCEYGLRERENHKGSTLRSQAIFPESQDYKVNSMSDYMHVRKRPSFSLVVIKHARGSANGEEAVQPAQLMKSVKCRKS